MGAAEALVIITAIICSSLVVLCYMATKGKK